MGETWFFTVFVAVVTAVYLYAWWAVVRGSGGRFKH